MKEFEAHATDAAAPMQPRPFVRRQALYRAMERLLLVYLFAVVAIMWIRGNRVTPDLFFVFAGIAALLLGRGWAFVRDWFPLVAIFLAWQASRGIAWQAGFPVHSDDLIAAERLVHFGIVPSEWLQANLRPAEGVSALDVALTVIYHSHFVLPLTLGFALWLYHRRVFHRYMAVLLLASIAQFVTALVFPAAPPRFAGMYGESLAVVDVGDQVKAYYHFGEASWLYQNLIANPVAAFPSLHAAYPIIAWLGLRMAWPRLAWLGLVYTAVVWFAIVYLGHHYLVDAYGGALYALAAFATVRWWMRRSAPRPEAGAVREPA